VIKLAQAPHESTFSSKSTVALAEKPKQAKSWKRNEPQGCKRLCAAIRGPEQRLWKAWQVHIANQQRTSPGAGPRNSFL